MYDAMGGSYDLARKFIGLILWEVMCNREEQWYFQKIDKTIVNEQNLVEDIQVMEYFRAAALRVGRFTRRAGHANVVKMNHR
ncbi:MAG: hypothetical protein DMG06_25845 [Acidobacteria bacterium]|nr:MAG: hypothetical protein DMG06_25845 [Acidobacteriota bacterium]